MTFDDNTALEQTYVYARDELNGAEFPLASLSARVPAAAGVIKWLIYKKFDDSD